MKQAAIFDMDGLLFDTERLFQESWVETAQALGFDGNKNLARALCGASGADAYAIIHTYYPQVDAKAFHKAGIASVEHKLESGIPIMPGANEILSFFQTQGIKMAVASGNIRNMVEHNLHRAGMYDYFNVVVCGEDVARSKPKPDIFLKAAQCLNYAPTDCYVFEDSINGVLAGIAAGCKTIMVPDLNTPTDDIRAGCATICSSLNEVCALLRKGAL